MHEATCRIEKGGIGGPGQGPLGAELSCNAAKRDQRSPIAGCIEALRLVIDIEAMCACRWEWPMLDVPEIRQSCDQDHRRIPDGKEDVFPLGVRHAPAWPAGEADGPSLSCSEIDDLELRAMLLITDAGSDRELSGSYDGDPVRPRSGREPRNAVKSGCSSQANSAAPRLVTST
jgi:hypothetical protein